LWIQTVTSTRNKVNKSIDLVQSQTSVYFIPVKDNRCPDCGTTQIYDGLEHSILNMGKFLVHYSLLRDYMFHFLHGKRWAR